MKENKANKQLLVSGRACKGREAKPIWLCVRTGLSCTVHVHDTDMSVPVMEHIFKIPAGPTRHLAPWFRPRTYGGDCHGTMEGYPRIEDVCISRSTRAYMARVHQLHHASSTRSSHTERMHCKIFKLEHGAVPRPWESRQDGQL